MDWEGLPGALVNLVEVLEWVAWPLGEVFGGIHFGCLVDLELVGLLEVREVREDLNRQKLEFSVNILKYLPNYRVLQVNYPDEFLDNCLIWIT